MSLPSITQIAEPFQLWLHVKLIMRTLQKRLRLSVTMNGEGDSLVSLQSHPFGREGKLHSYGSQIFFKENVGR